MYRGFSNQGEFPRGPASFGHPPPGPPTAPRFGGPFGPPPSVPPTGHLPHASCRPFLPPGPDSNCFLNRPLRDHYISQTQPHCSSFSIDHSTVITLGNQQTPPPDAQHLQRPKWNAAPLDSHHKDNSEKAGEEFLRCLATNRPLPDYLKGDMVYNLADAFNSSAALKALAPVEDRGYEKQRLRSKSRSASRSRGKSRARSSSCSRAKSRARSKSRAPSRSRGKSRGRSKSRARSRSRSRGKSRARSKSRAKSRARSRARSRSRSHGKSKSKGKDSRTENRSRRSPGPSCSGSSVGSHTSTGNTDLLQGLRRVINSKDLEDRMPGLKNAILNIQASNMGKEVNLTSLLVEHESSRKTEEQAAQLEQDSMLLPHERVGSDFSWLHASNVEDSIVVAQKTEDSEDEESFLYGNGNAETQPAPTMPFTPQSTPQMSLSDISMAGSGPYYQNKPMFSNLGDLLDQQKNLPVASSIPAAGTLEESAHQQRSPSTGFVSDTKECEKMKMMLTSIGLNLGTSDISKMMVKLQEQKKEESQSAALFPAVPQGEMPAIATAALGSSNVRQALESLQSLIKATKAKRAMGDLHGDKQKVNNCEEANKKEKEEKVKKKNALVKELENLLKDEGCGFLIPVIGFYCQKCEEFIGDLNKAESHAASHRRNASSIKGSHMRLGEDKGHPYHHHNNSSSKYPHPSDIRDARGPSYLRVPKDHLKHWDPKGERDPRDQRDYRYPDLKRKLDDDDSCGYRNDREKVYVKEERDGTQRMMVTVVQGPVMPQLKDRVKEEESKPDKGAVTSAPATAKHGRAKQVGVDSKGKPSREDGKKDKNTDREDSDDSSDDEKDKTPKGHKKKKKKDKKKKEKKKKKDKDKEKP